MLGSGPTIEDAQALLSGIESKRLYALNVLSWVERFDPNPSAALCLAALFHDIDGLTVSQGNLGLDALRSARFIVPALSQMGFSSTNVARAEFLISHHEDASAELERLADAELNNLVLADVFAFLTIEAPTLLAGQGIDALRNTVRSMIAKLPESARAEMWEHHVEHEALDRLKTEVLGQYYREHSPREQAYKYCPTCRTALERKPIEGARLLVCKACDFVYWNPPSVVTSVIIEPDHRVLMIRRARRPLQGYWCLPGGFVQYSETPEMAAIREVKEETGLDVRVEGLAGVYQIDNAPGGLSLDIIWKASVAGGSLTTNEESTEAGYFDRRLLPAAIAYKHRQAIEDSSPNDTSPPDF